MSQKLSVTVITFVSINLLGTLICTVTFKSKQRATIVLRVTPFALFKAQLQFLNKLVRTAVESVARMCSIKKRVLKKFAK